MTTEEREALTAACHVLEQAAKALQANRRGALWIHRNAVIAIESLGDTLEARDVLAIASQLAGELRRL